MILLTYMEVLETILTDVTKNILEKSPKQTENKTLICDINNVQCISQVIIYFVLF